MCFYTKEQDEEMKNYVLPDWFQNCNGILIWKENLEIWKKLVNSNSG